jgi:hypothetical protein
MNHDNVNHVNVMINPMNNFLSANECVICLESTFPLSHNINCSCKYYYHQTCIDKLPKPTKCLMCKKEWVSPSTSADDDADKCSFYTCFYTSAIALMILTLIILHYKLGD